MKPGTQKNPFILKTGHEDSFCLCGHFLLAFAPRGSLFFSRTWTMKVSNKAAHTAGERMAEVRAPPLTPGEVSGMGWTGPASLGEISQGSCFTKPHGGNSKAGIPRSPARWGSWCSHTYEVQLLVLQRGHFHQGQPWAEGLPPSLWFDSSVKVIFKPQFRVPGSVGIFKHFLSQIHPFRKAHTYRNAQIYILCAALEHLITPFFSPLDSMPLFNMENPFVYLTGYWVDKYINYLEAHWPLFFPVRASAYLHLSQTPENQWTT